MIFYRSFLTLCLLMFSGTVIATEENQIAFFKNLAEQGSAMNASVIEGKDGWLFLTSELRHLGVGKFWGDAAETAGRATRPDARDPLPPILAFYNELKARGVELVIVPVPPKAFIMREKLPGADEHNTEQLVLKYHNAFYEKLRAEGITVLDMIEAFTSDKTGEHGPLYCRQDSHWSGAGCVTAAKIIAEHVNPVLKGTERRSFDLEWRTIEITGDLWRMLGNQELPKEETEVRIVNNAKLDQESPVILLGDSHTLIFHAGSDMHCRDAGLPEQLALELGLPVDLIGVRGSGATPARINLFRRAQKDVDYWNNKKLVIWVFATREFTESDGWRIVPVAK